MKEDTGCLSKIITVAIVLVFVAFLGNIVLSGTTLHFEPRLLSPSADFTANDDANVVSVPGFNNQVDTDMSRTEPTPKKTSPIVTVATVIVMLLSMAVLILIFVPRIISFISS